MMLRVSAGGMGQFHGRTSSLRWIWGTSRALVGPQKLFAFHCPSGQEAGGPTHDEHGNHGLISIHLAPLPHWRQERDAAVVISAVIIVIMAMITVPICVKIHISHSVLLSITSREHMVPIVVEAHFSWALGGRSSRSLFQIITWSCVLTEPCTLQRASSSPCS